MCICVKIRCCAFLNKLTNFDTWILKMFLFLASRNIVDASPLPRPRISHDACSVGTVLALK